MAGDSLSIKLPGHPFNAQTPRPVQRVATVSYTRTISATPNTRVIIEFLGHPQDDAIPSQTMSPESAKLLADDIYEALGLKGGPYNNVPIARKPVDQT